MDETKNTKNEQKVEEFNLDEEISKSKLIKSYPATANFFVESGKFKSYFFKCGVNINGKLHTRAEKLRNEYDIKMLNELKKTNYKAEFQIRQNNESGKLFYCWVVEILDDYKHSMLVNFEERRYLEHFVLPKEFVTPKEKVAK